MDILFIYPAESEGFEPPVPLIGYTAFRVRLFRPLRQLSLKAGAKVLLFYDICKFFCKKSTICGVFFDFNPQIVAYFEKLVHFSTLYVIHRSFVHDIELSVVQHFHGSDGRRKNALHALRRR